MNTTGEHIVSERHQPVWPGRATVVRASVVIGTIMALVASVGAPFKWH